MDKNKTAYKILRLLADGRFHSGQELAKKLGITRSGVWKAIQQIEAAGLEVHAVTGKGYRLPQPVDLLDKAEISPALSAETEHALQNVLVLSTIPSTNDYLREQAQTLNTNLACLAEHQTQGRGRRGRTWVSAYASGLYLSVLWHFNKDAFELIGLSLAVAVAVIKALESYGIHQGLSLKWPNDILWKGQKLGGILVDLIAEPHAQCKTIIGIGINTFLPESIRANIDQLCADVAHITERPPKRNYLASLLLNELASTLIQFEQRGLAPFLTQWRQYDALCGKKITVQTATEIIPGIMHGISSQGELLVQVAEGEIKRFLSGEVSLRGG